MGIIFDRPVCFTNSTTCFKSQINGEGKAWEHDYTICRNFHHRIMDSSKSTVHLPNLTQITLNLKFLSRDNINCTLCALNVDETNEQQGLDKKKRVSCWSTKRWSGVTSASHWNVQLRCGWLTRGLPNQISLLVRWWCPLPPRKSRYVSVVFEISHLSMDYSRPHINCLEIFSS